MLKEFKILFGNSIEMANGFENLKDFPSEDILSEDNKIIGIKTNIDTEDEEYEYFKTILADFIVTIGMNLFFHKYLSKKFSDNKRTSIIRNHLSHQNTEYYYFPLTKLILDEYLKKNNTLNLTTFIQFNMHGMQKDIQEVSQLENELDGKLISPAEVGSVTGFKTPTSISEKEEDESFNLFINELINGYKKTGIKKENQILHIFWKNGLNIINDKGDNIDFKYIEKSCSLEIETDIGTNNKDEILMACFVLALEVFGANTIVIYKSVPEEDYQDIMDNIGIFKEKRNKEVDIFMSEKNHPGGH